MKYGWIPDIPDQRDKFFISRSKDLKLEKYPANIDLRSHFKNVLDQGELGSCTANAIASAIDFARNMQGFESIEPSRLFIYYNERVLGNTTDSDSGASIRNGIKTVTREGTCKESLWPYRISDFKEKPSQEAYRQAINFKVLEYQRLNNSLEVLKDILCRGIPFIFGFSAYESFESRSVARTGKLLLPKPSERLLGGHAVLCVGYDEEEQVFIIRNSWGKNWGMNGYFTMPYAYVTNEQNLSSDFWIVTAVW